MPWDWLADPELSAAGALDDCEADAELSAAGAPDDCEADAELSAAGALDDCEADTELSAAGAPDDCEADADCVELSEDADEAPLLAHPISAQSAAHTSTARILFMISSPSVRLPFRDAGTLSPSKPGTGFRRKQCCNHYTHVRDGFFSP